MRPHEGSGSACHLIAGGVDKPSVSDINATLATDPPSFRNDGSGGQRFGEQQVERGGQQKSIINQAVRGIKGRIVQHLEITCAVNCASSMVEILIHQKIYPTVALLGNSQA